jgi:hypothetical protein
MSRGDRIIIWVDMGAGVSRQFEVAATRKGRSVEHDLKRGMIEVTEVNQNGGKERQSVFMASRVIALEEERTEAPEGSEPRLFGGGE